MTRFTHEGMETLTLPPREKVHAVLVEARIIEDFKPLVTQPTDDAKLLEVRAELEGHIESQSASDLPQPQQELPVVPSDLPKDSAWGKLHELAAKRRARLIAA